MKVINIQLKEFNNKKKEDIQRGRRDNDDHINIYAMVTKANPKRNEITMK